MTKLYTAAEIAELRLPDLPATKRAIQLRAEKEGWQFETKVGLGGIRKVYAVPAHYFALDRVTAGDGARTSASVSFSRYVPLGEPGDKPQVQRSVSQYTQMVTVPETGAVAGTIVAGHAQGDLDRIQLVVRAVTEWEAERGVKISDERRPAVIAVLYDYLKKAEEAGEGSAGLDRFLAALG